MNRECPAHRERGVARATAGAALRRDDGDPLVLDVV